MRAWLDRLTRRVRRNLIVRVWAAILGVLVVAGSINTAMTIYSLRAQAQAELDERLRRLASVLASSLARPLFDINGLAISSVASAMATDPDVAHLRILAPDGTVLADQRNAAAMPQRTVSHAQVIRFQAQGRDFEVGKLELVLSATAVDSRLRWQMLQAGLSGLVLTAALTLALYLIGRRITRPFEDIEEALARLARGDTAIRLSGLRREDQIGAISMAVDRFRIALDDLRAAEQQAQALAAEKAAIADRLRAIYEGSSDAIMLLNARGFFDCNASTLAMFGIASRADFARCHPGDLSPEFQPDGTSSAEGADARIREAFAQGTTRFEWVHRRADGTDFPAEVLITAFEYEGERVLQATVRDITERKRIEAELQQLNAQLEQRIAERTREIETALLRIEEGRRKLQGIVDTALDAVVRIDADGTIIGWNAQAEVIFGWPAVEILGQKLDETIIPHGHRTAHREGMSRYMAGGAGPVIDKRIEITALRRSGEEFPIELAITRVALEDLNAFEFCAFIRDITERRAAEDGLRQTLAKQRELNQLKSRFVTMASHEFRTPLATIQSSADLLSIYLERLPESERKELFASITAAIRRMTGMLEDILIIGKDDADKIALVPQRVDPASLFQAIVREVSTQAGATRGVQPEIALHFTGLPERAWLDEKLVRQIVGNLLSNAVKYSPPGAPVHFEAALAQGDLQLKVSDQGIGIPPADLPRLFETFHRASNVGNVPGTGLGLAIVKRAVDLHGGEIAVRSELGMGTTFSVRLPPLRPPVG